MSDDPQWIPPRMPAPFFLDESAIHPDPMHPLRLGMRNTAIWASLQSGEVIVPPKDFHVLVSQAIVSPLKRTDEGELITAVTFPFLAILQEIIKNPLRAHDIDPRKWEEFIAASYEHSGLFDEVTLTPRSGDHGKDLVVVKKGFGSVRLVESIKRYKPGHVVKAEEVDALIGVLNKQPQTSKGIISTTSEFAPKIMDDEDIARLVPTRLELVNGAALIERLKAYAKLKGGEGK